MQGGSQRRTQRSPSRSRGGVQTITQAPSSHTLPCVRQLTPQAPQFFASMVTSVHVLPQQCGRGGAHPGVHDRPGAVTGAAIAVVQTAIARMTEAIATASPASAPNANLDAAIRLMVGLGVTRSQRA